MGRQPEELGRACVPGTGPPGRPHSVTLIATISGERPIRSVSSPGESQAFAGARTPPRMRLHLNCKQGPGGRKRLPEKGFPSADRGGSVLCLEGSRWTPGSSRLPPETPSCQAQHRKGWKAHRVRVRSWGRPPPTPPAPCNLPGPLSADRQPPRVTGPTQPLSRPTVIQTSPEEPTPGADRDGSCRTVPTGALVAPKGPGGEEPANLMPLSAPAGRARVRVSVPEAEAVGAATGGCRPGWLHLKGQRRDHRSPRG